MNTASQNTSDRASVRASRASVTESTGAESLGHHLSRTIRSRVGAAICGVLDPCIAWLQGLRKQAGGAPDADVPTMEERRSTPRAARPGEHHEAVTQEIQAPKPRRRLLTYLIYFSVLLAGGLAGGAVAYELLEKLLHRQSIENQRTEAAMAKQSKSVASNQSKLDKAEAKRSEAEKNLVEAKKKLETALKDSNALAEKQKKLDQVAKLLEQIRAADAAGAGTRLLSANRSGGNRSETNSSSPKSADCTLSSGNIKAMRDCLESFNR